MSGGLRTVQTRGTVAECPRCRKHARLEDVDYASTTGRTMRVTLAVCDDCRSQINGHPSLRIYRDAP